VSAEILMCLKDSNAKTREAANTALMSLSSKLGTAESIKIYAAALGAETPHMKSAAVMAFSRLVFEFAWDHQELQQQLPFLLRTVIVLMNEDSREVVKSVVGFIRVCVSAIPPENLQPLIPDLVGSLLTHQKAKDRFRAKIKIILKKLVKRFGYDDLMPHVPSSETRLLTHMRKLEQRQRRKKELSKGERPGAGDFDDMLSSDEEDSGDGRTLTSKVTRFSNLSGRKSSSKRSSVHQSAVASTMPGRSTAVRVPNEADGEVVDMLGANVKRQVTFAEDKQQDDDSDEGLMEFDDDGRLIVHDDGVTNAAEDAVVDGSPHSPSPNKRRRYNTTKSVKHGADSVASSKRGSKERTRDLGAAYKSKKAGGDVKRKNQKYEPYAYMPLNAKSYSKKNRRTAVAEMSSVVRKGKRKRN